MKKIAGVMPAIFFWAAPSRIEVQQKKQRPRRDHARTSGVIISAS